MELTRGKKIAIGVGVGLLLLGGWAYTQYQKLMDYVIGYKGIKVKSASGKKISFDLFLNYTNKSDVQFYLLKQDYKVYMNGILVSNVRSNRTTAIAANSISELPVNVEFDPRVALQAARKNWLDIIAHPENVTIHTEMEFTIGLKTLGVMIPAKIPYVYDVTLKEIISWYK